MINSDIKYCLAQIELSEPFFAWVFGGIVGFETNVEADNKEAKVIPKPDSTSDSQILQWAESVESHFRVVHIVEYVPDVSGIDKECQVPRPGNVKAIFGAQCQF